METLSRAEKKDERSGRRGVPEDVEVLFRGTLCSTAEDMLAEVFAEDNLGTYSRIETF